MTGHATKHCAASRWKCFWGSHDWSEWEYENPQSYALDLEDMYRYCSRCRAEQCKSWLVLKRERRRERHFSARNRIAELEAENERLNQQLADMGVRL